MIKRLKSGDVGDEVRARIIEWSKANGIKPQWVTDPVFVDFGRREIHFSQIVSNQVVGGFPVSVSLSSLLHEIDKLRFSVNRVDNLVGGSGSAILSSEVVRIALTVPKLGPPTSWESPGVVPDAFLSAFRTVPLVTEPGDDLTE